MRAQAGRPVHVRMQTRHHARPRAWQMCPNALTAWLPEHVCAATSCRKAPGSCGKADASSASCCACSRLLGCTSMPGARGRPGLSRLLLRCGRRRRDALHAWTAPSDSARGARAPDTRPCSSRHMVELARPALVASEIMYSHCRGACSAGICGGASTPWNVR